jgi:hypothetical protein
MYYILNNQKNFVIYFPDNIGPVEDSVFVNSTKKPDELTSGYLNQTKLIV